MPLSYEELKQLSQSKLLTPEQRAGVLAQMRQMQSSGAAPVQVFTKPGEMKPSGPTAPVQGDWNDFLGDTADAAAIASGFVPGPGWGLTAARIAAPPIFNAIGAYERGEDPLKAARSSALLGVGGEGAARIIPKITTPIALAMGGAIGPRTPERFKDMVKAFNSYFRSHSVPLLPGRGEAPRAAETALGRRVQQARDVVLPNSESVGKGVGQRIERAEDLNPTRANLPDEVAVSYPYDRASLRPTERAAEWSKFNTQNIVQQAQEIHGLTPQQWAQLLDADKARLVQATELSTRQAGELQRATSRVAGPAIKAAKEGTPSYMTANEANFAKDLMGNLRKFRHGVADVSPALPKQSPWSKLFGRLPEPGQQGAIKAADTLSRDLHVMQAANDYMRAGGIMGDPSLFGIRGALAGGIGAALGGVLGGPTGIGMGLPAGMLLLNPQAIGGTGFAASRLARSLPTAVRGANLFEHLFDNEQEKKDKSVKRRNP